LRGRQKEKQRREQKIQPSKRRKVGRNPSSLREEEEEEEEEEQEQIKHSPPKLKAKIYRRKKHNADTASSSNSTSDSESEIERRNFATNIPKLEDDEEPAKLIVGLRTRNFESQFLLESLVNFALPNEVM